ncbi:expressed unknown protein [Seminavis robusta]|uniref:DUF6824 domain-containing protein n=1 Tax=Seminavis robusta TaxID=568900 RepID=A0A9N8DP52_9STRA|nr:expressed unknown protein [Seminavis robusta]|eukprot:Sro271_g104410.1 n/a (461) ;mRNA; f:5974-7677
MWEWSLCQHVIEKGVASVSTIKEIESRRFSIFLWLTTYFFQTDCHTASFEIRIAHSTDHQIMEPPAEHSSYDPAHYGPPPPHYHHYPPPPHAHGYYPPTSAASPHQPHPHLQPGSSSDNSHPYGSTQQGPSPPSYPTSSYTDNTHSHSSSFESSGSSHSQSGSMPPPYPYGAHPPSRDSAAPPPTHHHSNHSPHPHYYSYPMMPPGPPHPGYHHGYPWPPQPTIQYVHDVRPTDVLSGRGGATNCHSGNRAFRAMVKKFQPQYLKAKKRDKPSVAVEVVQLIRKKGGRFLRRCDVPGPQGEVMYFDIGDRRATEKACQALREGAPAKRRGGKDGSAPTEEEERCMSSESAQGEGIQASSTSEEENKENMEKESTCKRQEPEPAIEQQPIFIRPSPRLLRRPRIQPISISELSPEIRDTYLREFLPPHPMIEVNKEQENKSSAAVMPGHEPLDEGWSVVGV